MHIVMFGDQHLDSLGGAQVSMRLQKRFLEKAGHRVTVVAPRMHARRKSVAERANRDGGSDLAFVDLPSVPITVDREYSLTWPGRRADRWLDREIGPRGPVDVVHVQADFWGAVIGHRFAARHGLSAVHTMHNRVDVGLQAVAPFPRLILRALNAWQRRALGIPTRERGRRRSSSGEAAYRDLEPPTEKDNDGWAYLRRYAHRSVAVTAPSSHFARRLEQHGAVPQGGETVDVVWNGIDDGVLEQVLESRQPRPAGPPRLLWLGRMSPEKRLLPFLEAVAESGIRAEITVIGGGAQLKKARRLVAKRRPTASVDFVGRVPYVEVLERISAADAVVQTSIGFETQGMTVFEAAALGTPSVVCDPDIGAELESGFWPVDDASASALAGALRRAAADIEAGTAPRPSQAVATRFRQSSRTEAMLEVYRRVTG